MWGSYIGLLFLGATFVAVGLFCSSITDNQVISFIISLILCLFIYKGFDFIAVFPFVEKMDNIILALGISHHYASISRGVIDTRDVIYFISLITIFLLSTKTVLKSRKWEV
jgi:ABC-2 type transport system permease protein